MFSVKKAIRRKEEGEVKTKLLLTSITSHLLNEDFENTHFTLHNYKDVAIIYKQAAFYSPEILWVTFCLPKSFHIFSVFIRDGGEWLIMESKPFLATHWRIVLGGDIFRSHPGKKNLQCLLNPF